MSMHLIHDQKMTVFLKKHILKVAGIIVGGIAGFAYYHFVGCASGTCPITSSPYISTIYGALMGYLLFDMFKRNEKTTK